MSFSITKFTFSTNRQFKIGFIGRVNSFMTMRTIPRQWHRVCWFIWVLFLHSFRFFGGEFQYQSKKFVKISIRRLLKIWFSLGVYIKVVPKIIPLFKTFAVFFLFQSYTYNAIKVLIFQYLIKIWTFWIIKFFKWC